MKKRLNIIKFGGITFIIAGILFFVQYLFFLPLPSPPLVDKELITWLTRWRFNISMADEVLLFAALFLIPSIVALYQSLVKGDKIKALVGCGILALTIPIYVFLDIILGRLVYPVYNLEFSPDIYKLILSIYYGGMHMIAILLCLATTILCFAIRKSAIGKPAANIGFIVAIFDLIGAFPWLIGNVVVFISQLLFSAWFIFLGIRLLRVSEQVEG
jgi:hypothetical protein